MSGLIDTTLKVFAPGGNRAIEATYASWPKCWRCSERLQREYPVAVFGDVEFHNPTTLASKQKLSFSGECHGKSDRVTIEVPRIFGPSSVVQAIGRVFMFGPGPLGKPVFLTRDKWLQLAKGNMR